MGPEDKPQDDSCGRGGIQGRHQEFSRTNSESTTTYFAHVQSEPDRPPTPKCHPGPCAQDPSSNRSDAMGFGKWSSRGTVFGRHPADEWVLGTRPRVTVVVVVASRLSAQNSHGRIRGHDDSFCASSARAQTPTHPRCHPGPCAQDPSSNRSDAMGFGKWSSRGTVFGRHPADEWVLGTRPRVTVVVVVASRVATKNCHGRIRVHDDLFCPCSVKARTPDTPQSVILGPCAQDPSRSADRVTKGFARWSSGGIVCGRHPADGWVLGTSPRMTAMV